MKEKLQNTPTQHDIKEDVEDLVRDLLMSIEESIAPLLSKLNAMHSDLVDDDREDHILSVEVSMDAIYGHMETKNRQGDYEMLDANLIVERVKDALDALDSYDSMRGKSDLTEELRSLFDGMRSAVEDVFGVPNEEA